MTNNKKNSRFTSWLLHHTSNPIFVLYADYCGFQIFAWLFSGLFVVMIWLGVETAYIGEISFVGATQSLFVTRAGITTIKNINWLSDVASLWYFPTFVTKKMYSSLNQPLMQQIASTIFTNCNPSTMHQAKMYKMMLQMS